MNIKWPIVEFKKQENTAFLLAGVRILFAALCLFSSIRFLLKGWVNELLISPKFHFHYFGFEWVNLPENPVYVYALFGLMILSSVLILTGRLYHLASSAYFLLFTYFELIDKTYYLNHYYAISLLALAMVFIPANKALVFGKIKQVSPVSNFYVIVLRVLVGVISFYAGIATLNSDWLFSAPPLSIWLNAYYHLPVIGPLLASDVSAFVMSYAGMFFDVFVVFFLLMNRTRRWAYLFVILFHLTTSLLFPIGVFPYVMMVLALVFFPSDIWQRRATQLFKINSIEKLNFNDSKFALRKSVLFVLLFFHLIFPFRYLLYSGNLFWHEQGFRFSWRVMLMEKNGYTELKVVDDKGQNYAVSNAEWLTPLQEKMMTTQPDFILEYAKILKKQYSKNGINVTECYAESYVSLNGRMPFRMIQNNVNLLAQKDGFSQYNWVTNLK